MLLHNQTVINYTWGKWIITKTANVCEGRVNNHYGKVNISRNHPHHEGLKPHTCKSSPICWQCKWVNEFVNRVKRCSTSVTVGLSYVTRWSTWYGTEALSLNNAHLTRDASTLVLHNRGCHLRCLPHLSPHYKDKQGTCSSVKWWPVQSSKKARCLGLTCRHPACQLSRVDLPSLLLAGGPGFLLPSLPLRHPGRSLTLRLSSQILPMTQTNKTNKTKQFLTPPPVRNVLFWRHIPKLLHYLLSILLLINYKLFWLVLYDADNFFIFK